ncbi:hypothetical protein CEXT_228191 [Caerostris extrusa]|uniref:Uncharacterized protein n=1 Tax=Caerostris extrusa TaxID=172846 RepID=A0AAV4S7E0_CAEEX|nr:hypothetical protein CEXT_228191 [Caerostris extrusa]
MKNQTIPSVMPQKREIPHNRKHSPARGGCGAAILVLRAPGSPVVLGWCEGIGSHPPEQSNATRGGGAGEKRLEIGWECFDSAFFWRHRGKQLTGALERLHFSQKILV